MHIVHRPAIPVALGFLTSLIAMGGLLAFASLHATRLGFENVSVVLFVYGGTVEHRPDVTVARLGNYFAVKSAQPIVIDRRQTGVRHAVWYSCIAGLRGCRISQWDKDALRFEKA
jgi:hypothetical protein